MTEASIVLDRNTSNNAASWWELECGTTTDNGSSGNKTNCQGGHDYNPADFDVLKSTWASLLVFFVYMTVIIVGAVGNLIVVLTVIKTR